MPSLKEIAAHHQLMFARTLHPTILALLSVTRSISTLLQQQERDNTLDQLLAAVRKACCALFYAIPWELADVERVFRFTSTAGGYSMQGNSLLPSNEAEAALACLVQLPFAVSDVLQVAAGSSTSAAAAAAVAPSALSSPAADHAGPSQGTGTSSTQPSSSSAQAGSRSPTPAASPQQRTTSVQQQQPMPHSTSSIGSSSASRTWGCHYAGCTNLCGVSELVMPVYGCSGCRSAGFSYACTYCSSACQQADWPVHKQACRQVRRQSSKGPQQ
jgi:hypothetical protein